MTEVSLPKMAFETLLHERFKAYFKDHKEDMSQLYIFYRSIVKNIQVKKSFRTFLKYFIDFIEKNDIKVSFKNGFYGGRNRRVLSHRTLEEFMDTLLEVYMYRTVDKSSFGQTTLWHETHISFDIKIYNTHNEVLVFRNKVYQEDEEMILLKYNDAVRAVTDFRVALWNIPHADDEIKRVMSRFAYIKKMMLKYSSAPEAERSRCLFEFESSILYVYEHLQNLRILLDEYIQNPQCNDLLLWMEDNAYEYIMLRVEKQREAMQHK
jgi:hypothetical protein